MDSRDTKYKFFPKTSQTHAEEEYPNDILDIVYSYAPSTITSEEWQRLRDAKKLGSFLRSFGLSEDMSYRVFINYITFTDRSILVNGEHYIDIYLDAIDKKWTRQRYLNFLDTILLNNNEPYQGFWFMFSLPDNLDYTRKHYHPENMTQKGNKYVQLYLENDEQIHKDVNKLLQIYIALPAEENGYYNNTRDWPEIIEYIQDEIEDPEGEVYFDQSALDSLRDLYNKYQRQNDPLILLQMASLLNRDQMAVMEM